jgi:hypothetical protein
MNFSSLSFSLWWTVLWYWAAESRRLFSLACTEEKSEPYLWAVAVVKPVWETAIRFLDSATARPLEGDLLCSALPQLRFALRRIFTRMECWSVSVMDLYMSLFQLFLICLLLHLKYIAVALFYIIFFKLKSGRCKHIIPTLCYHKLQKSQVMIY